MFNYLTAFLFLAASIISFASSQSVIPLQISDLITHFHSEQHHSSNKFSFNFNSIDSLTTKLFSHFELHSYANVSIECQNKIDYLLVNLKNDTLWSWQIIDSFGKLPSGILNGHFSWLGEFSQCRNATISSQFNFTGNYALISKPLNAMNIIQPESTGLFRYGLCAPIECSKEDVAQLVNSLTDILFFTNGSLRINSSYIQFQQEKPLDHSALTTLTFLGMIVFICLIGTAYDLYKRYVNYLHCQEIVNHSTVVLMDNEEEAEISLAEHREKIDYENLYFINLSHEPAFFRLLVTFSIYTNTKKIFKIDSNNNQQLACLHGIRVLSLFWVILGHSYAFGIMFSDNRIIVIDWLKRFSFLIVSNAFFSVDSFFLISGLLTCFLFLKYFEKTNLKFSFWFMLKYYVHRVWRLSPPYFICILISANLSPYFGLGPLYPQDGFEYERCQNSWYWNILYINNLVKTKTMCFGISWYLANDMQFHWIAPIILIPLALKRTFIGFFFLIALLVVNLTTIPLTLIDHPGIEAAQFGPMFAEFFNEFYILPWCRIAPFLLGILTGYMIILHKRSSFKISQKLNITFWLFSLTVLGLLVFGLYPDAQGTYPLDKINHIVYQTLSRLTWSICLSYIIYACITKNGGIVNKILSARIWVPLSRLSYSAFLVHTMVIIYFYATQEHLFHIQDSTMIYFYLSNVVFSYTFGYLVSVLFEIPLINLEKFIL